jgi:hypothetical protein
VVWNKIRCFSGLGAWFWSKLACLRNMEAKFLKARMFLEPSDRPEQQRNRSNVARGEGCQFQNREWGEIIGKETAV